MPTDAPNPAFVDVLPFDGGGRAYSYAVPPTFTEPLEFGQLVRVPLGPMTRIGVIWDVNPRDSQVPAHRLKSILQIVQMTPAITPDLRELAIWLAAYYAAPLNSVLETILPAAVRNPMRLPVKKNLRITEKLDDTALEKMRKRAPKQASLYEFIAAQSVPVSRAQTLAALGVGDASCDAMIRAGIISQTEEHQPRDAYDDELGDSEFIAAQPPELNEGQRDALDAILSAMAKKKFHAHLLHGVTGSGKTEVYIGAIRAALAAGGSAIFLVPEVALTPQTVGRLRGRLNDTGTRVVVWHSHLSAGERHDAWFAMASGEARVVVGARSAVFAPMPNLKLIVVDEEHEPSYKQGETPLYHGRDVAVYRSYLTGAIALLGSATPSLETLANVKSGKYGASRLFTRIDDRSMPRMRIIDMRRELFNMRGQSVLSRPLVDALYARLKRGEQSILFLNRRGFHRLMICSECGHVPGCPHCSMALAYHREDATLRCHECGHREPAPRSCPKCGSAKIRGRGAGTEKLEDTLARIIPDARIMRLDADSMSKKNLFRQVLGDFRKGKIDVLLGTQMLAKGLDFPNVTLVGIIDADLSLHIPDFRAAERTFQLLVQVAGRAGRGDREGEVFVQTFTPGAAPIQYAKQCDFDGFLDEELSQRREHNYPPARHFIRHIFRGRNETKVSFFAGQWTKFLEENMPENLLEIRGPAPCALERLEDQYRWNIWYFTHRVTAAVSFLATLRAKFNFDPEVREILDVDAIDVM